jgi:hypothetical protein
MSPGMIVSVPHFIFTCSRNSYGSDVGLACMDSASRTAAIYIDLEASIIIINL